MATVDQLLTRASERAGLDDFGGDSWREGLQLLVEAFDLVRVAQAQGRVLVTPRRMP